MSFKLHRKQFHSIARKKGGKDPAIIKNCLFHISDIIIIILKSLSVLRCIYLFSYLSHIFCTLGIVTHIDLYLSLLSQADNLSFQVRYHTMGIDSGFSFTVATIGFLLFPGRGSAVLYVIFWCSLNSFGVHRQAQIGSGRKRHQSSPGFS